MEAKSLTLKCKSEDCGKPFLAIAREQEFYTKKNLPLPQYCPACRHKQRMALRGERQLYKRTCDCCKKSILSTYPADAPYPVYCHKCFWDNIG